jgi:hypothetical protein
MEFENKKRSKKLHFRCDLAGNVNVIPNSFDPVEIESDVEEANLVSPNILTQSLQLLPFRHFLYPQATKKDVLAVILRKFDVHFRSKGYTMFHVETSIMSSFHFDSRFFLHSWDFPSSIDDKRLWKNHTLLVDLPFVFLFLTVESILFYIKNKSVENLAQEDVSQFIIRNTKRCEVKTSKGKIIPPQARLVDLADFQAFIADSNATFTISVDFN